MARLFEGVVKEPVLEALRKALGGSEFVDGSISAGAAARSVKRNLQLVAGSSVASTAGQQILRALQNHEPLVAWARPRAIMPPTIARYDSGMAYGPHLDEALMGRRPVRTDLSATVFLSDPDEYEGGELVLELGGELRLKGPAGSVFVYPSGCRHQVTEVTRGQRLVAVTWIESFVRDEQQRELLYELLTVSTELAKSDGKQGPALRIKGVHDALLRRWAET